MTDSGGDQPRTGLRIGWIVFALLVIALAVSGWFILRTGQPIAGRPTAEPMLGGAGSIATSPLRPPSRSPSRPPSATATPPTNPGQDESVSGIDEVRTVVCTDNAISISGVRNTVTVNGHCGRVDVSGIENTVIIDAADAIDVSGIRNWVRFLSGAPELTKSGIDNTLERG